jgi:hypothetical protein
MALDSRNASEPPATSIDDRDSGSIELREGHPESRRQIAPHSATLN